MKPVPAGAVVCRTLHHWWPSGIDVPKDLVTGMANIRDVIPFPRTPGNAEF